MPVGDVNVANSGWSATLSLDVEQDAVAWQPRLRRRSAVDATPILKDIPRVTPEGFWSWAESNENETLRFNLNYELAESLSRAEKARLGRQLAHQAVDLLERYVDEATTEVTDYDVTGVPKCLAR